MSSTDFEDRYRLMKCVAVAGGIRTHHAQERANGRIVMVHVMDEVETGAQQYFQGVIEACPPPHNARILETALLPGGGYAVVTDFLQGFSSFRDWLAFRVPGAYAGAAPDPGTIEPHLDAHGAGEPPADAAPRGRSTVQRTAVGDADLEHSAPPATSSSDAANAPSAAAHPAAPVAPAPKPAAQPGEFTRVFGSVSAPAPQPVTPPVTPASPPAFSPPSFSPPASATPPAGAPSLPVEAPAPAAPKLSPGEFTRIFSAPHSPTPTPAPTPPTRHAPPPSPSALDRTGLPPRDAHSAPLFPSSLPPLGASAPAPQVPAPLPFVPAPAPMAVPPMPAMPPAPQVPVVPPLAGASPFIGGGAPPLRVSPIGTPSPAGSSGGEYTRIIKAAVTPPTPTPPMPSAIIPPPKRARSLPLGLIITLNVVLLLAVALILYFVLRPAPSAATKGALPTVPGQSPAPAAGAPASPAPAATPAPAPATP
jgi:hypothetical protein